MSMYHGNNPTAIRTQKWLVKGLLTLMNDKPYSSITILDLCKKSDLSRQTFYNFFHQKKKYYVFAYNKNMKNNFPNVETWKLFQ